MKTARPHTAHGSIELLDTRIAPAGLVTATYAAGNLTLSGDGFSNELYITAVGIDTFVLIGESETTFTLNGGPSIASMQVDGKIDSLRAQMGGGNDSIRLAAIPVLDLMVDGAEGDDVLRLLNQVVSGPVVFRSGNGNDTFLADGGILRVGGSLTLDLGEGSNSTTVGASSALVSGPTTILGGLERTLCPSPVLPSSRARG